MAKPDVLALFSQLFLGNQGLCPYKNVQLQNKKNLTKISFRPKNCWSKKMFLSKKNLGSEIFFGLKKILVKLFFLKLNIFIGAQALISKEQLRKQG